MKYQKLHPLEIAVGWKNFKFDNICYCPQPLPFKVAELTKKDKVKFKKYAKCKLCYGSIQKLKGGAKNG